MGVCEIPVVSTVCHAASKAASSVVSAPFEWIAGGVAAAAQWMFEGVWQLFDATTAVNLTEPGYLKVYDVLFGVAIFLMLLFFFLQLITGLIGRDPGALRRAALGLAKSVLGSFLVISLVGLALEITDELCIGIIQATGNTLHEMGGKIAALAAGIGAISLSDPASGAVIVIFLGFLAISGAVVVWGSLLVRKALLLVAVVLAPVALSGQSWDAARGWVAKWASFVVAMIVSKLVLVVIFLVAINQMAAPIDLGLSSIANPVAGIVLMFVGAFAPYMAYKFISFIGFDLYHAMSVESEAKQALNRPLPVPSISPAGSVSKLLAGGGTSQAGSDPEAQSGGSGPGGHDDGGGGAAGVDGALGGAGDAGSQSAGGMAGGQAAAGSAGAAGAAGFAGLAAVAAAGPAIAARVAHAAEQQVDAGQRAVAGAGTHDPGEQALPTPDQSGLPVAQSPAATRAPSAPDMQPGAAADAGTAASAGSAGPAVLGEPLLQAATPAAGSVTSPPVESAHRIPPSPPAPVPKSQSGEQES